MTVRQNQIVVRTMRPFEIGKAAVASLWKSGFMGDTFVRGREQFQKYQRSFIGDMAKLAVKGWLIENGADVVDWDDVRTSWRSQRKQFDLSVNGHSIEVRSSISQYASIRDTLHNESIIHPCNVSVKEITVQVFFKDFSCDEVWLFGWTLQNDLENDALRSPRRIGPRLVDFYLMPFDRREAHPIHGLIRHLS